MDSYYVQFMLFYMHDLFRSQYFCSQIVATIFIHLKITNCVIIQRPTSSLNLIDFIDFSID